ncbi:MAG TPA: hypothetical protein DEF51_00740 [Myxococcales bacterium]|nr:hypothetical protein [Myxococcales bacterium]
MRFSERTIVPLPAQTTRVSAVRGTLLGGSMNMLGERGLREAYYDLLPEEHHEAAMSLLAMSWIPLPFAEAHYRAMQALVSDPEVQRASGLFVGERVQKSYLSTVVAALRASGVVTPARLLTRMPTIWDRMFRGGSVGIDQIGPKDLRVRAAGLPLFSIPYFRQGWEGVWKSGLGLVTRKTYLRRVKVDADRYDMTIAWV